MNKIKDGEFTSTVDLQDLAVIVSYKKTGETIDLFVYALDAGARKVPITDLLTENQREVLLDEIHEDAQ